MCFQDKASRTLRLLEFVFYTILFILHERDIPASNIPLVHSPTSGGACALGLNPRTVENKSRPTEMAGWLRNLLNKHLHGSLHPQQLHKKPGGQWGTLGSLWLVNFWGERPCLKAVRQGVEGTQCPALASTWKLTGVYAHTVTCIYHTYTHTPHTHTYTTHTYTTYTTLHTYTHIQHTHSYTICNTHIPHTYTTYTHTHTHTHHIYTTHIHRHTTHIQHTYSTHTYTHTCNTHHIQTYHTHTPHTYSAHTLLHFHTTCNTHTYCCVV